MTLTRCDNCSKETSYPVFNWYKVERWAYPDHTDKSAPKGPWHFCSMKCMGELFSRAQRIDTSTLEKPNQFVEHLVPFNPSGFFGREDLRYKEESHATLPQWLCNHANENPNICNCPPNCSCRIDMCKGKSIPTRYL